jgi:hypothetical protein
MRLKVLLGTFIAALGAVPTALAAGGSAQKVYGGAAGVSQAQVATEHAATASSSGALPFTGLDLVLLGGGGVLLLLVGVALYMISRPRTTA